MVKAWLSLKEASPGCDIYTFGIARYLSLNCDQNLPLVGQINTDEKPTQAKMVKKVEKLRKRRVTTLDEEA